MHSKTFTEVVHLQNVIMVPDDTSMKARIWRKLPFLWLTCCSTARFVCHEYSCNVWLHLARATYSLDVHVYYTGGVCLSNVAQKTCTCSWKVFHIGLLHAHHHVCLWVSGRLISANATAALYSHIALLLHLTTVGVGLRIKTIRRISFNWRFKVHACHKTVWRV